jgi:hypothetical protein
VRCKRFPRSGGCALASMYPVSDWSLSWLPTIMDSQRACELISGQASTGHVGHQCSHAPGRPIFHFVSSSRRPRRVNAVCCVIDRSSCVIDRSSFRAFPLFVPCRRFLRPGLRRQKRRAPGAVKAGCHAGLASRSFAARPRLDGPEHGAMVKLVGTSSHSP